MNRLVYFLLALKASMFSTGGFGNVPSLHDDLLARRWATERNFSESFAVGQVSPGPNGLWIISFGYLIDGLPGALLSLAAITIPPLFILGVDWLYHRTKHHPAVEGSVRGMSLATVGVFSIVLVRLLHDVGFSPRTLALLVVGIAAGAFRQIPVILVLAAAAIVGLLIR